jgi:hypothetical protein
MTAANSPLRGILAASLELERLKKRQSEAKRDARQFSARAPEIALVQIELLTADDAGTPLTTHTWCSGPTPERAIDAWRKRRSTPLLRKLAAIFTTITPKPRAPEASPPPEGVTGVVPAQLQPSPQG